jgi:stearoyl-CoA desaturase (delta-9 desaturase)
VNSLCHVFGRRRYDTPDNSRNSLLLALLTLGEGWHNNHHHYPAAARQGFFWWEIDLTYYVLRVMAACGIIRELKPVPAPIRDARARRLRFPGGPRRADGNGVTQITVSHPAKVAQS